MTFSRPKFLDITRDIFDDLAGTREIFAKKIRQHYIALYFGGGYEPTLDPGRMEDAWVAFQRDKKHAPNSMPDNSYSPDHFKLSGILVYWLRRFAPVYDVRDLSAVRDAPPVLSELLKKYPSELPAFDLGMSICSYFENPGKLRPDTAPDITKNDYDYYKTICYVMKFKSLSPHSMGMIYRSLFVPIVPTPKPNS